jgi:hypothetical protein
VGQLALIALLACGQICIGKNCTAQRTYSPMLAQPVTYPAFDFPATLPVAIAPVVTLEASLHWYTVTENGRDRAVLGKLGTDGRIYWEEKNQPPPAPSAPPAAPAAPKPEARAQAEPEATRPAKPPYNGGIELEKMNPPPPGKEAFRVQGNGSQRFVESVLSVRKGVVEADQTDDSKRPHLTIIGAQADRRAILKDMEPGGPLAWVRGEFLVQDYDPDDWAVTSVGLPATGKPEIVVQAHTDGSGLGKVVLKRDRYEGPEKLAESLRKCNPSYNPDAGPDGTPGTNNDLWWIAGGVLGLILILGRPQPEAPHA